MENLFELIMDKAMYNQGMKGDPTYMLKLLDNSSLKLRDKVLSILHYYDKLTDKSINNINIDIKKYQIKSRQLNKHMYILLELYMVNLALLGFDSESIHNYIKHITNQVGLSDSLYYCSDNLISDLINTSNFFLKDKHNILPSRKIINDKDYKGFNSISISEITIFKKYTLDLIYLDWASTNNRLFKKDHKHKALEGLIILFGMFNIIGMDITSINQQYENNN